MIMRKEVDVDDMRVHVLLSLYYFFSIVSETWRPVGP